VLDFARTTEKESDMKKKEWPELLGFSRAGALVKETVQRSGVSMVLCRVFPEDIRFEYPKSLSVPFVVIKERRLRSATLLFSEDGTAWLKKHVPNEDQASGFRSRGCAVFHDHRMVGVR
jgi:hypothetical protein